MLLNSELDKWARENNLTRLELTVVSSNMVAKHLYEKNGFKIEGTRKNAMIIDDKYVDKLIERLELKDRMNHLPGQLSGGQQQRVALARALINRPSLLLCDEPTGNLDKKTTQSVMELLFDMSKEYSVTLLVVTHDENIAKRFSRVITISDGILGGDI